MPEFAPGVSKKAIAPITVSPTGLSCEVELFLGPDDITKVATSGRISFTSTGASQDINLPITMPSTEGNFHVYIDVYAGGYLIAAYKATEDVTIIPAPPEWVLVPCVYCGATFSTETGLISHMESNHPGMPYLIYAYPVESQVARGGYYSINYKAYIPTLRALPTDVYSPSWILWITMGTYYSTVPFAYGAWQRVSSGQGFIEGSDRARAMYNPAPYTVYDIPRGTYPLVSGLGVFHNSGHGPTDLYWWKISTGQTITVV